MSESDTRGHRIYIIIICVYSVIICYYLFNYSYTII